MIGIFLFLLFKLLLLDRKLKSGMCLSGGGYRATVFHIGSLRRLVNFVIVVFIFVINYLTE
jgi:hypothetical protein